MGHFNFFQGIVSWIDKKSGPAAKDVKTVDEVKEDREDNDIVVIGFFKDQDSKNAKTFLNVAAGRFGDKQGQN